MLRKSMTALAALLMLVPVLLFSPHVASASSEVKLAGFVDVPGSALTLPVSSPVTVMISFGAPAVQVSVQITAATQIEAQSPPPVTLADGDRVKVEAVVTGGTLQAVKIELEEFPELKLKGTVGGLPAAGLALPLAAGTSVDVSLSLGAPGTVTVHLTSATKIEEGPLTLVNGDSVEVEAVFLNLVIQATELSVEVENEPENEPEPGNG